MKRFIYAFAILFMLTGCASKDDDQDILVLAGFKGASEEAVTEAIEDSNLMIDGKIKYGGYVGYQSKFQIPDIWNPATDSWEEVPKYCLILTGSGKSMGYQAGYLRAEHVFEMTNQFIQSLSALELGVMGIDKNDEGDKDRFIKLSDDNNDMFVRFWHDWVKLRFPTGNLPSAKVLKDYVDDEIRAGHIPRAYLDEMQGVADGATQRLSEDDMFESPYYNYQVEMWQVFFINQTYETLLNMSIAEMLYDTTPKPHKSNQIYGLPLMKGTSFAIFGDKTVNGDTLHGRDFMFENGGVWQDANCVIIRLPADGRIPTITTTPAGLVGFPDAMNRYGLSMDFNMAFGDAMHGEPSMSGLLITRDILEHSKNIDSAIKRFRKTRRSSTWNYLLADDDIHPAYGRSVVLESGRNIPNDSSVNFDCVTQLNPPKSFNPANWMRDGLWRTATIQLKYENPEDKAQLNSDGTIKNGVMIRSADWTFPENGFETRRNEYSYSEPATDQNWYGRYDFDVWEHSPQIENEDDFIISANHYVMPRMQYLTWSPAVAFTYGTGGLQESEWRYEMTKVLTTVATNVHEQIPFFGNYETPVYGSAAWICDMLNPGHQNPDMVFADSRNLVSDWGKTGSQTNHFYTQDGELIYAKDKDTKDKDHYYIYYESDPADQAADLLQTNPAGSPMNGHHTVYNNSTRQVRTLFGHMNDDWVKINFADLTEIFYY